MATNGDDTLNGTPGDDTLDGLEGADTMIGGPGDDAYYVDSMGDTVVEYADEGFDTIYSSAPTYFLPDGVERLVLVGNAVSGFGNGFDNQIFGNSGDNTLLGQASDDLLDGGAGGDYLDADGGNDSLYGGDGGDNLSGGDGDDLLDGGADGDLLMGGDGNDMYVFRAGYGQDFVSDSGGLDSTNDSLFLAGGLTADDVTLERSGDDLLVRVQGTDDLPTLDDWFVPEYQIESIVFQNETVVDAAGIEAALANSAPTANDDAAEAFADDGAPVTGNVLDNDTDPDSGTMLAVTTPGTYQGVYGTLVLAEDGSYSYTLDSSLPAVQALAAGEPLAESFAYGVSDGTAFNPLGATAQLEVSITGANDAPVVANAMADQSAQAGEAFSFALPAGAFTDVDNGDSLSYSATLADGSALPAWLQFDAATGTFTGTAPSSPDATTLQVQVTASDLAGATASDAFALAVAGVPPAEQPPAEEPPAEEPPCERPFGRHIVGTRRKNHLDGTSGDDLIEGRDGNDRLHGKRGVDILQGGKGNDELKDRDGNTLFDGGHGNDRMTGGRDDDFFAGGRGNDKLYLGGGADVVAFNKGDGVDRLFGARQDGVLSLGGGIRYEDLKFSKHGGDLVLETGGRDRIVLEDWYRGKQSVVTLQVVAEAMAGFSQSSSDPLRNDRVEVFDFRQLVEAYDDARSCRRNLQNWKLMNELLDAHLGGSDQAAYGGDVAYRYGMTGTLAGVGWGTARNTVADRDFGSEMQALQPAAEVNAGPVKLG
jgi:VCBS repeat-containing protein